MKQYTKDGQIKYANRIVVNKHNFNFPFIYKKI